MSCLIIAEAGVNHNGSIQTAMQLIDAAVDAGANIVKFQTFDAAQLVSKSSPQADYQVQNLGQKSSQYEMLKKLELSFNDFAALAAQCKAKKIGFMSTPFDEKSLNFLAESRLIDTIKIPSGEITNLYFLLQCAWTGLPIILSTGMATLGEVEMALAVLAFGFQRPREIPNSKNLWEGYLNPLGQSLLRQNVTLLHCTSEYPAPLETVHLNAMPTLRATFGLSTGYSDHTADIAVSLAAATMGAAIVEKHFTLSRHMEGPDHAASLEPSELKLMVQGIRQIEQALGGTQKIPSGQEMKTRDVVRKKLVARLPVEAGDLITLENVTTKRSPVGICASKIFELLGTPAPRSFSIDEAYSE